VARTYKYYIHSRKDPFLNESSWFVPHALNVDLMNEGAKLLLLNKDFTSFSKLNTDVKTKICHLTLAEWIIHDHRLIFTITADRFLRNMVRAIVGTLVDLGLGKITLEDLKAIIGGKDRALAGESVPAKGLFLAEVRY
jgi:tRNA pseudouridine38-40 synthase